ncbi:MAG: hypothetical protein IPL18_14340 [Sphingomonadales bacterium]|nr:hypothetical protein [Sphingomonadales bacterium]
MAIRPEQLVILKKHLAETYVAHLPPLLIPKNPEADLAKNVDRAFSAFAIQHICDTTPKKAAKAIVDDFDDFGPDALHYDVGTKTLYLVPGQAER